MDAAVWNSRAPQAWSITKDYVRRALPGVDVQFWKCWETQSRGVLHLHAILFAHGVTEKTMQRVWSEALQASWDLDGYRFMWGAQQSCDRIGSKLNVEALLQEFDPPEVAEMVEADEATQQARFVRYGAKYCTKGGNRASVVNRRTGEIRRDGSGYRTWSASSRWGDRMKTIRAEQRAWAASAGQCAPAHDGAAAGAAGALDPDTDFYACAPRATSEEGCL